MKKIAVVGILASVVLLAGCNATSKGTLNSKEVDLPNGKKVVCVTYTLADEPGGLTCDWANVK